MFSQTFSDLLIWVFYWLTVGRETKTKKNSKNCRRSTHEIKMQNDATMIQIMQQCSKEHHLHFEDEKLSTLNLSTFRVRRPLPLPLVCQLVRICPSTAVSILSEPTNKLAQTPRAPVDGPWGTLPCPGLLRQPQGMGEQLPSPLCAAPWSHDIFACRGSAPPPHGTVCLLGNHHSLMNEYLCFCVPLLLTLQWETILFKATDMPASSEVGACSDGD